MSFRILPKDPKFFELFAADGDNLTAAAAALHEMVDQYDRLDARVAGIQALEKRGDEIDEEVTRRLEDAFVTPFDREDIHELVSRLDDVVDGIQSIAEAFVIYGVTAADGRGQAAGRHPRRPGGGAGGGAPQARRASRTSSAIWCSSTTSRRRPMRCRGRPSGGCSARTSAPIEVIKWRDLYNDFEDTIDAAEDAAEAIERMYHKAS